MVEMTCGNHGLHGFHRVDGGEHFGVAQEQIRMEEADALGSAILGIDAGGIACV